MSCTYGFLWHDRATGSPWRFTIIAGHISAVRRTAAVRVHAGQPNPGPGVFGGIGRDRGTRQSRGVPDPFSGYVTQIRVNNSGKYKIDRLGARR